VAGLARATIPRRTADDRPLDCAVVTVRERTRRPLTTAGRPSGVAHTASVVLAVATVLAQIAYPLTHGEALRLLTITTVVLFAAASVLHAAATRGPGWALGLVVVAGGLGLAAEAVGVRTGVPFGDYRYADTLGPQVLDVPVVVPLAWLMMAYPSLLLGRRLARSVARRGRRRGASSGIAILTGALCLAAWDLFLDPQMVAAGHWTWAHPTPALPGVPGVPLTNYAGWLVVALVMLALLELVLPDHHRASEDVPGALLAWTWAGSVLGNAVFFDRPAVAVWGGVAMGLVVVPYLYSWWDGRP
jgi:carotene biosynthesis associated membrane protein